MISLDPTDYPDNLFVDMTFDDFRELTKNFTEEESEEAWTLLMEFAPVYD